jgi:hypothetical protein
MRALERLAAAEETAAAICTAIAAQLGEPNGPLADLAVRHIAAAAQLRGEEAQERALSLRWSLMWARLQAAAWVDRELALGWLRDRELALARRYLGLGRLEELDEERRASLRRELLPEAWARVMLVEGLLAACEWEEVAPL